MTIVHHAGKGGVRPRMIAQDAFARRQYAEKHFAPARRALYLSAIGTRHVIRAAAARPPTAPIRPPVARARCAPCARWPASLSRPSARRPPLRWSRS